MIIYRTAVPSDVLDLVGLVQEYCEEAGFEQNIKSVKGYIDMQLGKIPTIIAADNGTVVGIISFVVMPEPFKQENIIGKKIACFVSKDHRNKDIGTTLRSKAEEACKSQGAKKFYFSSTEAPEGYQAFETEYYKEL